MKEISISEMQEEKNKLKIMEQDRFSEQDILALLRLSSENVQFLFDKALALTRELIGNKIFFRGIIEFSNICEKNCFYCGIRRGNAGISRYMLTLGEILSGAYWAEENHYGSLVLQSGENSSPENIQFLEKAIRSIKKSTSLGITLSVGEQTRETYRRFFDAGAHRYLLRIETSSPELYRRLHPQDHSFEIRLECLRILKEIGMQVGTGVMIGLPFQTIEDLAKDILFFKREDVDMIGMGPYIIHSQTPLATHETIDVWNVRKNVIIEQTLKMIAVTRLVLRDVNIASTTALQALHPRGREMGLNAGANVIMPVITPVKYRESYLLYEGKPCIDDSAEVCRDCLQERIHSVGREVAWDEWGDPLHFQSRQKVKYGE